MDADAAKEQRELCEQNARLKRLGLLHEQVTQLVTRPDRPVWS
jgi:hypothetical protein